MRPKTLMHEDTILNEIVRLWKETSDNMRPYSLWISLHEPVESGADRASTRVVKAWYLDEKGVHERNQKELQEFLSTAREVGVFNSRPGRIHKIGTASFAPMKDSEMYYLEYMFGGAFGRGCHCSVTKEGQFHYENNRVWVS